VQIIAVGRRVLFTIVDNTITNLTTQHLGRVWFLNKSAGFDLIQSLVVFTSEVELRPGLDRGFLNYLLVSSIGIVMQHFGFIIGIMRRHETGWCRISRRSASRPSVTCRCCCRCLSGTAWC
jgi:general L-amino acid transport system permease protein